jgi:hypothetical protein
MLVLSDEGNWAQIRLKLVPGLCRMAYPCRRRLPTGCGRVESRANGPDSPLICAQQGGASQYQERLQMDQPVMSLLLTLMVIVDTA